MQLDFRKKALNAIADVADWVELKNTEGSGDRWLLKVFEEINAVATSNIKQAICKDPKLAKFNYRCFTYKDKWIVACKIEQNKFVVYRFIYGSWLDYFNR